MRINHVLVDYENVQPALTQALLEPVFKVWIFIGAQQTKVKVDLLDLVQRKGADAHVIRIGSTGRNALDFHMAYYLGELATKDSTCYLHVISKDTGLDPLGTCESVASKRHAGAMCPASRLPSHRQRYLRTTSCR